MRRTENMSHDHRDNNIEGIVFKEGKTWVAIFEIEPGRTIRSKIDFCPWCGERLE